MATENSNPEEVDWNLTRHVMAILQFQEKYLPEVRTALVGETLTLDNHETTGRVRAVIAEVCDRDRLVVPKEYIDSLVRNFIIALKSHDQTGA